MVQRIQGWVSDPPRRWPLTIGQDFCQSLELAESQAFYPIPTLLLQLPLNLKANLEKLLNYPDISQQVRSDNFGREPGIAVGQGGIEDDLIGQVAIDPGPGGDKFFKSPGCLRGYLFGGFPLFPQGGKTGVRSPEKDKAAPPRARSIFFPDEQGPFQVALQGEALTLNHVMGKIGRG